MKQFMIVLPFLLLFCACGQPGTTKTSMEKFTSTTYSNSLMPMRKQSNACREKSFDQDDALIKLHLFIDAKFENIAVDFFPYLRGTSLRDGKVIANTVYGEESEIFVTDEGMRVKISVNPRDLKICPDEENYDQDTIESAALNAAYFIHETNGKIKSVFPDLYMAPITLSIGPKVTRSIISRSRSGELKKDSMYITDNALYTPMNATITFLPHSKALKDNGFTMNFWEVPMVASHEYGHHVFQSIYTGTRSPLECFGGPPTQGHRKNKNLGFERSVKIDDVMTAYNEGFADLIAHYTLSEKQRDVTGVKCLEITRDVASPIFYNGKPKVFDEDVMHSFFSSMRDFTISCEDVSYQDVHVIGAIFANNADQFLGKFTKDNNEKLVAIVDWVKYLKAEKKKLILMTPKNFMKQTMSEFVRMSLTKFDHSLDADNCKLVKDIYPQLDFDECAKKER